LTELLNKKGATLVDLLERVLDKGLIINADLVISVSGIPLVGVNLRAALAGMKTMLKYGLMADLDRRIREHYRVRCAGARPALKLLEDEAVMLRMMGSYLYEEGIMRMWRVGYLYLTNRRLLLFRMEPPEKLLEVPLEDIKGIEVAEAERLGWKRKEIILRMRDKTVLIHGEDVDELEEALLAAVGCKA